MVIHLPSLLPLLAILFPLVLTRISKINLNTYFNTYIEDHSKISMHINSSKLYYNLVYRAGTQSYKNHVFSIY
jgi:hypothetical protein